jgi:fructosamine-3-kinase
VTPELRQLVGMLTGSPVQGTHAVPGANFGGAYAAVRDDSRHLFVKHHTDGADVPTRVLVFEWIDHADDTEASREQLGRQLARLHRSGADHFGGADKFIVPLPQDSTPSDTWPDFYAMRRLLPLTRACVDDGHLESADGHEHRVALHQLWPLLVHVTLFGGSYGGSFRSALARYA